MLKENRNYVNHTQTFLNVTTGLFIGGLIGAGTMLLLAPQSGKRTRTQIQQKGLELRDQTVELAQDTISQVQLESKKLSRNARHKVKGLMQQAQKMAAEQLAHVSEFIEARKKSILGPKSHLQAG